MNTHGLNNTAVSRSIESIQLKKYYYRTSRRLKSRGLLRTDLGEADSPYTSKNLIENFEKIALYDEYIIKNGKFIHYSKSQVIKSLIYRNTDLFCKNSIISTKSSTKNLKNHISIQPK